MKRKIISFHFPIDEDIVDTVIKSLALYESNLELHSNREKGLVVLAVNTDEEVGVPLDEDLDHRYDINVSLIDNDSDGYDLVNDVDIYVSPPKPA